MNKKIKNAEPLTYNNINFKSKSEVNSYKTLVNAGFNPKYEELTYIIWEGFYPTKKYYTKDNKTKNLKEKKTKLIDITYTPDFHFYYKNKLIIIEVKGFSNDVFPIKRKMFRKYLETIDSDIIYFEIYSKKHLEQAITIIKSL